MTKNKKKRSLTLIIRNYFITGVVVLIPIGFTLYLSKILIGLSSKIIPQNINPNNYKSMLLKISGIWESDREYGITFKFFDIN